jgi:hypothetical protein|nr:Ig-like domain-containing protein [uncultured Lachnoclostridium sp.]
MKNFFKKLAFVLALAMVLVSVAPATANAAAKAPSLKKTSKILYIGGDLTGTIPDSYRFYFNNAAGYTSTWESMDEDVVVIEGKTVVAVGVGKAVVKATLTNKAGKEVVREATVWVKQNAEKVGFGSQKAIESPIELGSKVKINVFRQVGDKKIWTQNDMATCTDVIKWTSSDEKVATVDKWGTVTAVGAGEATITATATQPQGPTKGESASYKVTVVSGLTAATQKDVNSVNLTFGTPVTKDQVNAKTVKLYEVVGTTKVSQLVSAVTIDEKDATKATLDSYVNFKKNATYVVEYDGKTLEFVAVDPSVESVKEVKILTTQAVKGKATKVEYQLLTDNGVDLTSVIPSSRVTVEVKGNDAWYNSTDNTVTFFESGKVATVKVVFHTYNYTDNGVENVIEAESAIVSVDETTATLGTISAWTLDADNVFDFKKDTVNHRLTLSEGGLYFIGKYVDSNKKDIITNAADSKFTFESSNTNVFIVNGNYINPVSEGAATLVIKYDGKAIDALAISVLPKRVPANVNATINKAVVSKGTADEFKIDVVVTDNYGEPATGNVTIELLSTSVTGAKINGAGVNSILNTAPLDSKGKASFAFAGTAFDTECNYNLKITADKIVKVVGVTAKKPGSATTVALNVGKTDIDTTLKIATSASINKADSFKSTISLKNVDANGLYVSDVAPSDFDYLNPGKPATGVAYYYELYNAKGELVPATGEINGVKFLDVSNDTFSAVVTSGSSLQKAPTGNYRVQYYSVDSTGAVRILGQTQIVVKDSQPVASVDQERFISAANSVAGSFLAGDIVIKLDTNNDGTADTLTTFDPLTMELVGTGANGEQAGRNILIKSVVYTASVDLDGVVYNYDIKINVGKQITLSK